MMSDQFKRALRAFSRRTPFVPFAIELTTGHSIEVTHPEAVILDGRVVIFRETSHVYRLFDSSSVCQLYDFTRPKSVS